METVYIAIAIRMLLEHFFCFYVRKNTRKYIFSDISVRLLDKIGILGGGGGVVTGDETRVF
jgi:hypothetical protein